ncbi:MAG: hypothetical protein HY595_04730 [Candidatus Omnitrophica bacterium]|nr:hypothetical protein [Candidatus Omnitrophota bacterium]
MWLIVATPLEAATRVTIADLKDYPERYYGQAIQLECHYDKESPIWVRALPDAEEWIGFFVVTHPDKTLSWSGEYYNLVFAPYAMRDAVRSLRGGDKITVVGEGFHYQSASFDGVGVHVQRILSGWGPSAKLVGELKAPAGSVEAATISLPVTAALPSTPAAPETVERYRVMINDRRYEGLRFGDQYNFDGVEFQVDR